MPQKAGICVLAAHLAAKEGEEDGGDNRILQQGQDEHGDGGPVTPDCLQHLQQPGEDCYCICLPAPDPCVLVF